MCMFFVGEIDIALFMMTTVATVIAMVVMMMMMMTTVPHRPLNLNPKPQNSKP